MPRPVEVSRFVERQLGRPSRLTGRLLNVANGRINARALDALEVGPDHRVIDVGFGGGVALPALLARAAFVAGADPSVAAVLSARARFRGALLSGRLTLEAAEAEALPFPSETFDRALAVHTIYFWREPERGLGEIWRVLRRGGRLALAVDPRGMPKPVAKVRPGRYLETEQARLLEAAGFSEIRFERTRRALVTIATKPERGVEPAAS